MEPGTMSLVVPGSTRLVKPGTTGLIEPGTIKLGQSDKPNGTWYNGQWTVRPGVPVIFCRTCTTNPVVQPIGRGVQQLSTYKLGNNEDSSCLEEKVEDFVLKLEKVVETKVTYFYTPSPKN